MRKFILFSLITSGLIYFFVNSRVCAEYFSYEKGPKHTIKIAALTEYEKSLVKKYTNNQLRMFGCPKTYTQTNIAYPQKSGRTYVLSDYIYDSPSLKITNTDFKCWQDYIKGGFNDCSLDIDVKIDYWGTNNYFDNLTYYISCEATFDYVTFNKTSRITFSAWDSEYEYMHIYGVNSSRTVTLNFRPVTIDPVIRVAPSNILCRVTNVF